MTVKRLFAIIIIFICTFGAWMILGGVTTARTHENGSFLKKSVVSLYGDKLIIKQPTLVYIEKKQKKERMLTVSLLLKNMKWNIQYFLKKAKSKQSLNSIQEKKECCGFQPIKPDMMLNMNLI